LTFEFKGAVGTLDELRPQAEIRTQLVESEGCTDQLLIGGWNARHRAIHVTQQISIAVDH
jgi:hypothetical protein